MNITSLIYMALMIVVPGFFIVFLNYRSTKKKEAKINHLRKFAEEQHSQLVEVENLNDYLLGIDKEKSMLFYADLKKDSFQYISLSSVKKSTIKETARVLDSGPKVTERVDLQLLSLSAQQAPIFWNFFDIENGKLQLSGEHQFLEKWTGIINQQISKMKP